MSLRFTAQSPERVISIQQHFHYHADEVLSEDQLDPWPSATIIRKKRPARLIVGGDPNPEITIAQLIQ